MGVTVAKPSYALRLVDADGVEYALSALRDERGRPYPWTPCMEAPVAFDEESSAKVKTNAARACTGDPREQLPPCPALAACHAQAERMLSAGEHPRGVWAGVVMPNQGEAALRLRRRRSRSHARLPDLPPDPIPVLV